MHYAAASAEYTFRLAVAAAHGDQHIETQGDLLLVPIYLYIPTPFPRMETYLVDMVSNVLELAQGNEVDG